ncbi:MAG: NADH-quinone oxidoreductase subunit N [Ignavibacteria bacterium]|nr:NADH-quinone oxidoreductase subunit N [Ignavibacteria bacterium]
MELQNYLNTLPVILVSIAFVITLLIEAFYKKGENLIYWFSLVVLLFTTVYSLLTINKVELNFYGTVQSGGISNLIYFILSLTTFLVLISSRNYLQRTGYHHGEFYILILSSLLGMMLMTSSRDLVLTFLALELMSLSFYVLAGFNRKVIFNNEASLKYFLLGAFASGFLLYGIALIYGSAQTTNIQAIIQNFSELLYKPLFNLGLVLLIIGFSFKVASVPFHMWVPDVYEGSPTVVSAFMSTAGKTAAFVALIVVLYGTLSARVVFEDISKIIGWLAIASMLVGSITAIAQSNLKRMLAYSSIAHAGYMLIGIAAANKLGMSGVIFYLTVYSFMNIAAFIMISFLESDFEKRVSLDDFKGLANTHPWFAAVMSILMFALSGLPPFGGFFGKYYVFLSAVRADMTYLAVVGVISSVISAYFYLRVVVYMYFKTSDEKQNLFSSAGDYFVLTICVLFIIQLGLTPNFVLDMITRFLL